MLNVYINLDLGEYTRCMKVFISPSWEFFFGNGDVFSWSDFPRINLETISLKNWLVNMTRKGFVQYLPSKFKLRKKNNKSFHSMITYWLIEWLKT